VSRAYELGESPLSDTLLARRQALEALSAAEQAQIDALEAQARLLLDMHAIWSLHAD
jgi:cobalt-zinc-cadmium efflux system outer membrane protein